jgi:hypothetical protein
MASLTALPKSQHPGSWGSCVNFRVHSFYGIPWANYFRLFFDLPGGEGDLLPTPKKWPPRRPYRRANALEAGDSALILALIPSTAFLGPTIFGHFPASLGRGGLTHLKRKNGGTQKSTSPMLLQPKIYLPWRRGTISCLESLIGPASFSFLFRVPQCHSARA